MGLIPYGDSYIYVLPNSFTSQQSCPVPLIISLIFVERECGLLCQFVQMINNSVFTLVLFGKINVAIYQLPMGGLLLYLQLLVGIFWVDTYHIAGVMECLSLWSYDPLQFHGRANIFSSQFTYIRLNILYLSVLFPLLISLVLVVLHIFIS